MHCCRNFLTVTFCQIKKGDVEGISKLAIFIKKDPNKFARKKMEILRQAWAVKAMMVIIFTTFLFPCVSGANITVGGPTGSWDLISNIQAWPYTTTFNIGDDLVFKYDPLDHSVMEVNEQGYDTCSLFNPLGIYNDGDTVIHISKAGTRYFVCGRMGHCDQGLKMAVHVLAEQPSGNRVLVPFTMLGMMSSLLLITLFFYQV